MMLTQGQSRAEQVEARVLQLTHGRIRNLAVEDHADHVVVRGQVSSHHTRQLALHGALELLTSHQCLPMITVG